MNIRTSLLLAAAMATVANCTPYQEIDRAGDEAAPVEAAPLESGTMAEVSTGSNDGGAMEVDQSVGVVYEIRTRQDIPAFVASQMTLADKDSNGSLTAGEYDLIAPALAQADNSINPSADGGPVANPGADAVVEGSDADAVRGEIFFAIAAGADAVLSSSELETALSSRFDGADTNKDGTLDAAESKAFAASMLFDGN